MWHITWLTFATAILSLPSEMQAGDQLPIPQDPEKQERLAADRLEWNRRTLAGAYERVGKKDPRWDKYAASALEAAAVYFSSSVRLTPGLTDVHAAAKKAIAAGCNDPMILYLYARSSYGANDPGAVQQRQRYHAAARAMEASAYPAFRRSVALYKAAQGTGPLAEASAEVRKESERLFLAALRLVPVSAEKDERCSFLEDDWYDTVTLVVGALKELGADAQPAWEKVDAELAKTPALQVVRLQAKGKFFTKYAWVARGIGRANTVTEQGWKAFNERLAVARQALEQAWALKPSDSKTAAHMLPVAMGLHLSKGETEKWFERAMKADGDNHEACAAMLEWLDPKWYGTREEMIAFGRACRDTKNWHTGITLLVADAHMRATAGMTDKEKGLYYYSPDVWDDIYSVYTEYLKHYPDDHRARSQFAAYCWFCARVELSNRQFQLLGDNLWWGGVFTEKLMKEIRTRVAAKSKELANAAPEIKNPPAQPSASPSSTVARSREFSEQKCRYTLPGKDWWWVDQVAPSNLCSAGNSDGFVVTLSIVKVPQDARMDQKFAEGVEKGFYTSQLGTKRGGHFEIFQWLPCYQAEAVMPDGRTMACRFFLANGFGYTLGVIGGKGPVELDPNFEQIMNGFSFTEPPVGADASPSATDKLFRVIEVFGAVAFAAMCTCVWVIRNKRTKRSDTAFDKDFQDGHNSSPRTPSQFASRSNVALEKYRKGMIGLGRGLVALGVLQLLIGALALAARLNPIIILVVGGMGAVHLVFGILALLRQGWVNYFVAIWSALFLAGDFFVLSQPESQTGGSVGPFFGLLVAGSLLYYSIKNLAALSHAKRIMAH